MKTVRLPEIVIVTLQSANNTMDRLEQFSKLNAHKPDSEVVQQNIDSLIKILAASFNYLNEDDGMTLGDLKSKLADMPEDFSAVDAFRAKKNAGKSLRKAIGDIANKTIALRAPLATESAFKHFMTATVADLSDQGPKTMGSMWQDKHVVGIVSAMKDIAGGSEISYVGLAENIAVINDGLSQVWGGGPIKGQAEQDIAVGGLVRFATNVMNAAASRVKLPRKSARPRAVNPATMELVV